MMRLLRNRNESIGSNPLSQQPVFRPNGCDTLLSGDLNRQAKELLALLRAESRKHGTAILDVLIAQPDRKPPSTRGEFDANHTPVIGNSTSLDQPESLKTVQRGRDCGDWGRQRVGDAADAPRFRPGQDLEKADIVRVKVCIDTPGQQTRLDAEIAHKHSDALMQGQRLSVLDGATWR
jgi:hypothetical protein